MTFSILAQDPETGAIGGAAATGSLCVGGWVLRGDLDAGMSASQGASPSTFWGEDVLALMRRGVTAEDAVGRITSADAGRRFRQLSALDLRGGASAFTGDANKDKKGAIILDRAVVAGNMLTSPDVLRAMADGFEGATGGFDMRLLAALTAARDAGGDFRGLLSTALLVLRPDKPPLNLRIDHDDHDPVGALARLHGRATSGDYARWTALVPVQNDTERGLD